MDKAASKELQIQNTEVITRLWITIIVFLLFVFLGIVDYLLDKFK